MIAKAFTISALLLLTFEAFGNGCYREDICRELGLHGNCRAVPYCREVARAGHCTRVSPLPHQFRSRKDARDWENICMSQGLEGGCNALSYAGCGWISGETTCTSAR